MVCLCEPVVWSSIYPNGGLVRRSTSAFRQTQNSVTHGLTQGHFPYKKALVVRDLYMQFRTLNSLVNFRKITRNSSLEYWIKRFKVNGILISEKPAQEIWVELSRLGFHWIRFKRNRADEGGLLLQNDGICGSLSPLFRTRNPHRLSQSSSELVWTQKSHN